MMVTTSLEEKKLLQQIGCYQVSLKKMGPLTQSLMHEYNALSVSQALE